MKIKKETFAPRGDIIYRHPANYQVLHGIDTHDTS